MKLFKTSSNIVITECRQAFNIDLLSVNITNRKLTFLLKYANTRNTVCHLFSNVAITERNDLISRLQ